MKGSPPRSAPDDERVFVTGGSGFIGANLVEAYLREGTPVRSFDQRPPKIPAHSRAWMPGDVRDKQRLSAALDAFEPTVVFHLAARTDLDGKTESDYSSNTVGVESLVAATRRLASAPIIVFASSRLVCEIGYIPSHDMDFRPSTQYGASKVHGERIVRASCQHAPWVIARPTSIWGPWFGVPYRNFFDAVLSGRYLHPKGKVIRKTFGYVDNTVYELQQLARLPPDATAERMFYLGDYEPIEVGELAATIARAGGVARVRNAPLALLRPVAGAGDVMRRFGWRSPPLTSFRLNNLLTEMVFDLSPLRATVGELPVDWTEGVRRTVQWLQADRKPSPLERPDDRTVRR